MVLYSWGHLTIYGVFCWACINGHETKIEDTLGQNWYCSTFLLITYKSWLYTFVKAKTTRIEWQLGSVISTKIHSCHNTILWSCSRASRSPVCLVMRCKARGGWPKLIVWVVVNIKGDSCVSRMAAPSLARLSFFDTFKNEKFSQ